jgi:succinate dehydrogenase flavin-adding protein (antitoxin of CptAB toxin-antitoxin module)
MAFVCALSVCVCLGAEVRVFLHVHTLSHTHTRTFSQVLAARDEKMLQMQEQTGTLTAALVQMLQVCECVSARA